MANFVTISQVGICDSKGRASATAGYRGRSVARVDFPIADSVAVLLDRLWDWVGWSSVAAACFDIDKAIAILQEAKQDVGENNGVGDEESQVADDRGSSR